MTAAESNKKHFEEIGGNTLDVFDRVSTQADSALSSPSSLNAETLSRNTFTDQEVVRFAARHNEDRLRNLQTIVDEPAIARIVARNEKGAVETYFISRATPPTAAAAGCRLASALAPIGRIASLPVGEELELATPTGTRTLEVLERALLRPFRSIGEWGSRDTILEGTPYNTVTIWSLSALLSEVLEADATDALLAEESARSNVIQGIRREVIRKMGLRISPSSTSSRMPSSGCRSTSVSCFLGRRARERPRRSFAGSGRRSAAISTSASSSSCRRPELRPLMHKAG